MVTNILITVITIFAIGFITYGFVELGWSRVGWLYSSSWSKPLLAILKAVPAGLAVWAREVSGPTHGLAVWAVGFGILGLLVWEIVDFRASVKTERLRKAAEQDVLRREQQIEGITRLGFMRNKLISTLGHLVTYKKRRVAEALESVARGKFNRDRPAAHCAGLNPSQQILIVLQHIVAFLRELLPQTEDSEHQNFRAAFYVEEDGYMVPFQSWDHKSKDMQFLQSYRIARDKFRMDCNDHPACAVRCVQEQRLLIVSDCETGLSFYHVSQRNYLKSLVAYPIIGYGSSEGRRIAASLVVDTDAIGFFKEEDRPNLETCFEQFALRIDLEMMLDRLLKKPLEGSDGKATRGQGRKKG